MFCGECGKEIPAAAEFCPRCGAKNRVVTSPALGVQTIRRQEVSAAKPFALAIMVLFIIAALLFLCPCLASLGELTGFCAFQDLPIAWLTPLIYLVIPTLYVVACAIVIVKLFPFTFSKGFAGASLRSQKPKTKFASVAALVLALIALVIGFEPLLVSKFATGVWWQAINYGLQPYATGAFIALVPLILAVIGAISLGRYQPKPNVGRAVGIA